VIRTITSVPPAIGVIGSSAVDPSSAAYASARVAGVSIGGSGGWGTGQRAPAAMAIASMIFV